MFKLTEEEFLEMQDNNSGFCKSCRIRHDGIEPDAREYNCESCDEDTVYGIEELLLMGDVDIIDEDE